MEIKIRDLVREDLPQLSQLYQQFRGESSDLVKMQKEFSNIEDEKKHIILVAVKNNNVIGSVTGIVCRELYGDCRPFLVVENMIVDDDIRGRGIGRKLMYALEERAKQQNCIQIILVTEESRTDACRFYESIGFQKGNKGYKKKLDKSSS